MASMYLYPYYFIKDPGDMTILEKDRSAASVNTYWGVAFFSWGTFIEGREIDLTWKLMTATQYASLQVLLEGDATLLFDPQDGSGKAYNVEILSLDGKYLVDRLKSSGYKTDVTLKLLILGEA